MRQVQLPSVSVDIATAIAGKADKSEIPTAADAAPPRTTSTARVAGSGRKFAREDHTHPTMDQAGTVTLDASGLASWMFPDAFDAEPNIPQPGYREIADGLPIVMRVKDFYRDNGKLESAGGTGKYTGVLIKAQRLSNTVNPVGISVVGIAVIKALTIDIGSGGNLAGVKIYLEARPTT